MMRVRALQRLLLICACGGTADAAPEWTWWRAGDAGQNCDQVCAASESMCVGGADCSAALKPWDVTACPNMLLPASVEVADAAQSSASGNASLFYEADGTTFKCMEKKNNNKDVPKWDSADYGPAVEVNGAGVVSKCYTSIKLGKEATLTCGVPLISDKNVRRLCCCRPNGAASDRYAMHFFCPTSSSSSCTNFAKGAAAYESAYDANQKRCRVNDVSDTSKEITTCPSGRYGNHASGLAFCQICPLGRGNGPANQTTLDAGCPKCVPGKYRPTYTNPKCTNCGAGKYGTAQGKQTETDGCNHKCPPGKHGNVEGAASEAVGCPHNCSAGKWANSTGLISDTQCPWCSAGRFGHRTGRTTPADCMGQCSAGRFGVGQTAVLVTSGACGDSAELSAPLKPILGDELCKRYARGLGYSNVRYKFQILYAIKHSSKITTPIGLDKASNVIMATLADFADYPQGCSVNTVTKKVTLLLGHANRYAACDPISAACICQYAAAQSSPPTTHDACTGNCSAGRWSNRSGLTSNHGCEKRCGVGRFSNSTGLTANSQCDEFPKGKWSKMIGLTGVPHDLSLSSDAGLCPTGRYSSTTGLTSPAQCAACTHGRYANTSGSTAISDCKFCPTALCTATTALNSASQICRPGQFSLGEIGCESCPNGTFSEGFGATACTQCDRGRTSLQGSPKCNRSVLCPPLTALNEFGASIDVSRSISGDDPVVVNVDGRLKYGDLIKVKCSSSVQVTGPSLFVCDEKGEWQPNPFDVTNPTRCEIVICNPPVKIPIGVHVKQMEGPSTKSGNKSNARVDRIFTEEIRGAEAPYSYEARCSNDARMLLLGGTDGRSIIKVHRNPWEGDLRMRCDQNTSKWAYDQEPFSLDNVRCQCPQSKRRGDGIKVIECVQCEDATYAPLDVRHERVECRACPREGVSCIDGILDITKDWWFDVPPTLVPDGEGKLGIATSTQLYKCSDRNACLRNTSAVPMTMSCAENHTSVLCASCFNRRVDCGRTQGSGEACVEPTYWERGREFMYFAKIARHCQRCPAGSDATVPNLLTAAVAILVVVAIAMVVVGHLANTQRRLRELFHGDDTQHNSTSPIIRLLLNWLQATSLLSTIKLTPPEAVQEASIWAEYAQGISTKSFFIRCTLRWDYYLTFAFEMMNPILSFVLPTCMVIFYTPIKRNLSHFIFMLRTRLSAWSKLTPNEAEVWRVAREERRVCDEEKEAKDRLALIESMKAENRWFEGAEHYFADARPAASTIALANLHHDGASVNVPLPSLDTIHEHEDESNCGADAINFSPPPSLDTINEHEDESNCDADASSVDDGAAIDFSALPSLATISEHEDESNIGGDASSADDGAAIEVRSVLEITNENGTPSAESGDHRSKQRARRFDVRAGYYVNVCKRNVALRLHPSRDSRRTALVVEVDATVRAEERLLADGTEWLRISCRDGTGWLPLRIGALQIAQRIAAAQVVTDLAYDDESVAPLGASGRFDSTMCGEDERDPVAHRFRALSALNPEEGITRDVIELIVSAERNEFEIDGLMSQFDLDGDGKLNLAEYREADAEICRLWRFSKIWSRFAISDADLDGVLSGVEVLRFLPSTLTTNELPGWIVKGDRLGAHGVITIADMHALQHVVASDERMTVTTAALTMAVFICYIRTAKSIMAMFSTEKINGVPYLKEEIGTRAYSQQHISALVVAAICFVLFVVALPVSALYIIVGARKSFATRKMQSAFGFLFEGYRPKMFFWEFVVLLRKVLFLAVALFWEDAFLQSVVALFTLVVSIIVHMACWPYEEMFLNIAELCSLVCLFTLVGLALLLWYVQAPGRTKYVVLYESAVTFIIFSQYAVLFAVLLGRVVYLELREKSNNIIQKSNNIIQNNIIQGMFERLVEAESWLYFQTTKAPLVGQRQMWSFLRDADDHETAEAEDVETTWERVKRLLTRSPASLLQAAELVVMGGTKQRSATALDSNIDWWNKYGIVVGDFMAHPSRGEGTIVAISPDGDARVHVEFASGEVHRYALASWGKIRSATQARNARTAQRAKSRPAAMRMSTTHATLNPSWSARLDRAFLEEAARNANEIHFAPPLSPSRDLEHEEDSVEEEAAVVDRERVVFHNAIAL